MGRKPAAAAALQHLIDRGVEVVGVVAPEDGRDRSGQLLARARAAAIPVVADAAVYEAIAAGGTGAGLDLRGVDVVLSFLFWKKIRVDLAGFPRLGCFNFHPAPLPGFRGRRGYNHAIFEQYTEYGASVHWVSDQLDGGDLVDVRLFGMAPDETALSLERQTMVLLLEMFERLIDDILRGRPIARRPQGPGQSATKAEMLALARVRPDDDPATIERRIRAFWFPPHSGATVDIGGRAYTLVDDSILAALGAMLHETDSDR